MELKTQDYEDAASSTTPPIVHTDVVRPAIVFHLLTEFAKAGDNLNKYLKKPLVYGPSRITEEHTAQFVGLADIDPPRDLTDEERAFAHGVVGVATEAAECVEALLKVWFFKEPWDRVNALEEGGDLLWYIVRFLKAAGYTLPEAMEKNWSKLENRHVRSPGETFNPDADKNRDLAAERALLEAPADARRIVEGAAAEPYLGLATNAQLRAEMEARASLGHTADDYRTTDGGSRRIVEGAAADSTLNAPQDGAAAAEAHTLYSGQGTRGIALLEHMDTGEEVWLDSYAGGAAPGGQWGTLALVRYLGADDTAGYKRTYIATDLLAPDGVKIKVGDVEVSATGSGVPTVKEMTADRGLGSFYEMHGRDKHQDFDDKAG